MACNAFMLSKSKPQRDSVDKLDRMRHLNCVQLYPNSFGHFWSFIV